MKTLKKFIFLNLILWVPLSFAGRWIKKGQVYLTDRNQEITNYGTRKDIYEHNGRKVWLVNFKEEGGRVFAIISERQSGGQPTRKVLADELTEFFHRQAEDN